jgi:hypothetical protein
MKNAPERTYQDMQQWSNNLIGRIYYELNPNNKNEFRTVRVAWNGFANKMVLQYSNAGAYVIGTPPDGMPAMNPRLRSSIVTMPEPYNRNLY